GPVWEANHVWMIFVIVVLFTCFPYGYAPLGIALFLPFHLVLTGIMLRGAAFVFRGHAPRRDGVMANPSASPGGWGFGIASLISPFLLGLTFGVVTEGGVRVDAAGSVRPLRPADWLSPYATGCGLLALSTCAYLAAVYLTVATDGALREDFRRRAILSGTSTAGLALLGVIFAFLGAKLFFLALFSFPFLPLVAFGLCFFCASPV